MSIFARSRQNLNLTPSERAFLKLCEGLACAGLVAALPVLADALAKGTVVWGDVLRAALAAAAVAVLLALAKYAKAHGDPPLGPAISQAASDVAADVRAGKTPQQVAADAAKDALAAATDAAAKAALPTA